MQGSISIPNEKFKVLSSNDNIDPRLLTPRSSEACHRIGIHPNELLMRPIGFFALLPEFQGQTAEGLRAAAKVYEGNRQSKSHRHGRVFFSSRYHPC